MSMICFCQSNIDLSGYGLKNVNESGLIYAAEILKTLNFSEHSWSNSMFCVLWDESISEMCSLSKNKSFSSTRIFSFLNSVTDSCEKIAIFHCAPSLNRSDWSCFKNKDGFYNAVEKALKDSVPYTYEQTLIYSND